VPHAEPFRAEPVEQLSAQLLAANARYARCWERGVRLGLFVEFVPGNESKDECATRLHGAAINQSRVALCPNCNRDALKRVASIHECHLSSFGYTFALTPAGAVNTSFHSGLVRPSALREVLQRSLPSTPRLAPPRMDVIMLVNDQTSCLEGARGADAARPGTVGSDCSNSSGVVVGMGLREAQIFHQIQSLGFRVHRVGVGSARSWISRMQGCLRWRLRAVVAFHTTLGIDARHSAHQTYRTRQFRNSTDARRYWNHLPVDTLRSSATTNESYPTEQLDIAIDRLRAVLTPWLLVVATDDVHQYRIMDTMSPHDPSRLAVRDWLVRRERHIYTSADAVLTVSEQDAQTIARLTSGVRSRPVHIQVLPYAPDVSAGPTVPRSERRGGILFVGQSHPVAVSSLRWFLKEVLPIISRGLQSHQGSGGVGCCTSSPLFTLAGQGNWKSLVPNTNLMAVLGKVTQDELESLYANAKVFVTPQHMTNPSGVSTKAINAIGRGLPVVTTSLVDIGLPPTFAQAVRVGANASTFASHVLKLLVDASAWSAQQKAGRMLLDKQKIERAQSSALRTVLTLSSTASTFGKEGGKGPSPCPSPP